MWNLPPPPGFRGLDPHKPVRVYQRRLPHWRQEGATYFVTFRLHDALPQSRLRELDELRSDREARGRGPEEIARELTTQSEHWLDQGMGCCRLKEDWAAQTVADTLAHFDNSRYELGCYVVMPNHVHAIVRPLSRDLDALERILQSWKLHTAREINQRAGLSGTFWQDESFDRIIRDEEHLYRCIQYVGDNPAKAGLDVNQCRRWIRPQWVEGGWRFEDRLVAPERRPGVGRAD